MSTVAMDRETGRALRALAKGTGFSVFQRSLIWSEGDLVAEVRFWGVVETHFRVKPMDWDRHLWSIAQLEEYAGKRVTRHWKNHACPVPVLDRRRVAGGEPADLAKAVLTHALDMKGHLARYLSGGFPAMMDRSVGGNRRGIS